MYHLCNPITIQNHTAPPTHLGCLWLFKNYIYSPLQQSTLYYHNSTNCLSLATCIFHFTNNIHLQICHHHLFKSSHRYLIFLIYLYFIFININIFIHTKWKLFVSCFRCIRGNENESQSSIANIPGLWQLFADSVLWWWKTCIWTSMWWMPSIYQLSKVLY